MFYDLPDQEGISLNAWKLEHRVRCLLEKRKIEIKKGIKKIEIKKVLHCLAISGSIIGRTIRKINVFILVGKMLLIFRTSSDGRGQKEAHVRRV